MFHFNDSVSYPYLYSQKRSQFKNVDFTSTQMEECKQDDTRCHQQYLFKQTDGKSHDIVQITYKSYSRIYPPGLAFVGFQRYSND